MIGVRSRAGMFGLVVGVMLLLAACGGKTAPAGGGGENTGKAGELRTRSIGGIGSVLQAPTGFTLYHLTTDVNGKITCTGGCASTWPPLIASSGKVPAASQDLAGHLATIQRPDGSLQVTFDRMPLYTYSGDSGPGQTNGQGVGGIWFAVTTSAVSPTNSGPGY
jgi:predicted lipoprotein with Yx(FWY)xxD motif